MNLDLIPNGAIKRVHVSQNDVGRTLTFELFNNSTSYSVPSGATVKIQGTKPSGFGFSETCTVSGNVATIDTTEAMTDESGNIQTELSISYGDVVIGTSNFVLAVEKNPHPDTTTDGSMDTIIPELTLLVNEVKGYAEEIEGTYHAYGSPWVASTVAEMTDTDKIYVYTGSETGYTSGNWYYYNGSAWVSGGVYNSVAVQTDTTLSVSGMPADAKVVGDEVGDLKSEINHISESANLFGNTSDEIYQFTIVYNSGAIISNAGGRVICVPCKPSTQYHITKNAGGRFVVGDLPAKPVAGNTCTQYYADNTASSIYYTTSGSAKYLVAFVYYNSTDGADYTTMLASVVVNEVSAIDYIARATTEKVENGYGIYNYNNDVSLLTNSGSGRYIIGHAFPEGYIDSVFVDVASSSEVEVRLYTLDNGVLNVAFYTTATSTSAGMLEIPIKKNALNPFYIMINRVSGGIMYRSNSAYDVYGVSAEESYTLASLTASHYEFGISVKYGLFRDYTLLGKNYLLIGDSYLEGYSADGNVVSWGERLKSCMGLEYNTVIKYKGGIGFIEGTGTLEGYSFKSLALNANVPDPTTITHIVVCGGYNDAVRSLSQGEAGILNAIEDFYNNVSPVYPNANIYIGMIGYRNNDDAVLSRIREAGLSAYQTANRYGANEKIRYLNNVEWTLTSDDMSSDGYHPNGVGQVKLAWNIKNALITGSAPIRTFARDND